MAMDRTSELEEGRRAYVQRRWADAFRLLTDADEASPLDNTDLEHLGRSASMIGRDDAAFAVLQRGYDIFLAMGDELGAARLAFWHGFRCFSLGETGRAVAWLARAEKLVARHGADCVEQGYLLVPAIHQHLRAGNIDAAFATATAAAAIGDRFNDDDLSGLARQLQGRALLLKGDVKAGLQLLDEAMLTATTGSGTELVRGLVYCSVIACCQQIYAVDRAREWTAVLAHWCDAQPQLGIFSGACRVHRAELMQLDGAWSKSIEEVRRVTGRNPTLVAGERAAAAYQEAEIHRLRGEFAAAERAYGDASEAGGETQPGLALLRLAQGQLETAAASIRRAVDAAIDPLRSVRFLPAYVEIMLATGDISEARSGAARLAIAAGTYGTPVLEAMAAHALGGVELAAGHAREALPALKRAFDIWQGLDAPYLAARIRVALGQAYSALDDEDGGRLELTAARKVFETLGARPDIAALDAAGPASKARAAGGLSAREVEVLRLAATGKTNKVIASELGLSPKTIDRHVSNILTKLDVPTRAAATAYAYQHGLIDA